MTADRNDAGVSSSSGPPKITTGKVYADYDRVVQRVEAWIESQNPTIPGCDNLEVRARLVQRVVELTGEDYVKQVAARLNGRGEYVSQPFSAVVTPGVTVCCATGAVSVSWKQRMQELLRFGGIWLRMVIFLFMAVFRLCPSKSVSATLLIEGGGGYEEDDERFAQFCKTGPIGVLSSARQIIVRALRLPAKTSDASISYAPQPLIHLASTNLTRRDRFDLLFQHLTAPIVLFRSLNTCSLNVLLSTDIAYVPMVQWLDKRSLIDAIVVTTSSFQSQPLWMKGISHQRFKLNMVWYSQNFMPKVYVGESERADLPAARLMRVDVHWAWTEGFKDYLLKIGQIADIRVVGPILWYLPEPVALESNWALKISVFDITPINQGLQPFGALKNYYSVKLIQQFVADIVAVCADLEVESKKKILILLKHKRVVKQGFHNSEYLDYLQNLEQLNSNFRLLDHHTNLFGLLEQCDISISVPYTSTVYVSSHLGKHAIYYDPFGELVPVYEISRFVHFASSRESLKQILAAKILD